MSSPAPPSTPQSYSSDPTLYLYTSLTAGSSHIITATSRLETILKAHKIPFRALDVATDEKARMLWGRRAKGRKLPGLVRMGMIVGDLEEVEEWNEYGELEDVLGEVEGVGTQSATNTPSKLPVGSGVGGTPLKNEVKEEKEREERTPSKAVVATPLTLALKQAGDEAAVKAKQIKEKAQAKIAGVKSPLPEPEPEPDHSEVGPGDLISSRRRNVISPPPKEGKEPRSLLKKAEERDKGDEATTVTAEGKESVERDLDEEETPTNTVTSDPASTATPPSHTHHLPPPIITTSTTSISPKTSPPLSKHPSHASSHTSISLTSITHTHHGLTHTHEIPQSPSFSPRASQHRGSSISLASDEEIREIERANAILEENEGSDSEGKGTAGVGVMVMEPENDSAVLEEALVGESPTDMRSGPGEDEVKGLLSAHLKEDLGVAVAPEGGDRGYKTTVIRSLSVNERKEHLKEGKVEKHISFAPHKAKKADVKEKEEVEVGKKEL
jgi:hypothetical protein